MTIRIPLLPLLLGLALVLWTALVHAQPEPAGQVIVASGTVTATAPGEAPRALKRRAQFYPGNTIATGPDGRAQLRMNDGEMVSLRPDTELRIDAFAYREGDEGGARENVKSLIKGGMRAITGAVGGDDYEVDTPVATIGIRGTHYEAVFTDGELFVAAWQGGISLQNEGGSMAVGQGAAFNFARVRNRTTPPQGLTQPPTVFDSGDPDLGNEGEEQGGEEQGGEGSQEGEGGQEDGQADEPAASEGSSTDGAGPDPLLEPGNDGPLDAGNDPLVELVDPSELVEEPTEPDPTDPEPTEPEPTEPEPTEPEPTEPEPTEPEPTEPEPTEPEPTEPEPTEPEPTEPEPTEPEPTEPEPTEPEPATLGIATFEDTVLAGESAEENGTPVIVGGDGQTLRIGDAEPGQSFNDEDLQVSWGEWNAASGPGAELDSGGEVQAIEGPVYWVSGLLTDPNVIAARSDSAAYGDLVGFLGHSSLVGAVILGSNAEACEITVNVNFSSGAVSGLLDLTFTENNLVDLWNVGFDGAIDGSRLNVGITDGLFTRHDLDGGSTLSSGVDGLIEMGFVGGDGQGIAGGYNLHTTEPGMEHGTHGVFVIREGPQ